MSRPFVGIRASSVIGSACVERFLGPGDATALPGLTLGGRSRLRPPYRITRPRPECGLILATTAGAGSLHDASGQRRLGSGDLLLLPPGHAHAYRIAGDSWEISWLHTTAGLDLPGPPHRHDPLAVAELAALLELLLSCPDRERRRHHLQALPDWLDSLGRAAIGPDPAQDALWRQVEERLAAPWTVAELGRRLGCSRPVLHRRCHARHGRSPRAHLAWLRMQRARQLLLASELGLRAIAAQVGYGNEFALSTAFKRCWGFSPDALRRRERSA